jgi:hypothetical protein
MTQPLLIPLLRRSLTLLGVLLLSLLWVGALAAFVLSWWWGVPVLRQLGSTVAPLALGLHLAAGLWPFHWVFRLLERPRPACRPCPEETP